MFVSRIMAHGLSTVGGGGFIAVGTGNESQGPGSFDDGPCVQVVFECAVSPGNRSLSGIGSSWGGVHIWQFGC